MKSFLEWKTGTILKLILLKQKYANNAKIVNDIDAILEKVRYAEVRDLSSVLLLFHFASSDTKDFLQLLPTVKDVERWHREGQ